jgi:predicted RNase H-like nuclease
VVSALADLLDESGEPDLMAIDMPLGLPDTSGPFGRAAERAIRGLLGARRSSVFSVPSRSAVYTDGYVEACAVAQATSNPPRKISKQCFHIFPKIRELDHLLRSRPGAADRVVECHPELAFAVLNGAPMMHGKKVNNRPNPAGSRERRSLLAAYGFDPAFLDDKPPRGAAIDDKLDACVAMLVAERVLAGTAIPHPAEEIRDTHGLRIAIWA